MVKAIKIEPCGTVSIVEPEEDEDYKAMGARRGGRDGWFLGVPDRWEHKKFKLSMTTLGFFTEEDPLESNGYSLMELSQNWRSAAYCWNSFLI